MFQVDWNQYRHGWTNMAAKMRETITEQVWSPFNLRREWDMVNSTPGRFVLWVRPEFIPSPAFADELDVYRGEGQLIITQIKYRGVFQLRHKNPYEWVPEGMSPHLVVFQLSGQTARALPSSGKVDIWKWLAQKRSWIYPLKQRWLDVSGAAATRSVLGDTFVSPWDPDTAGTLVTGHLRWWSPSGQLRVWREQVQAWLRLQRLKATSTSSL